MDPRSYRFGRFTLDVPGQRLFRDGELVPVTGRVFDTLLVLIRHRDRVVSKEELIQQVWHDAVVSEDSLTHNVSLLRRAFGDDANQPQFIATNARRGYRFIADVTESAQPAVPLKAVHAQAVPSAPARTGPRMLALVTATAVVASLAGALVAWRAQSGNQESSVISALFSVEAPAGTSLASSGVLSPDGRHLAFLARSRETNARWLWVRHTESGVTRLIPGSEEAMRPFWSPDSRSLGFFVGHQIKRAGLEGVDPARVIGTTLRPRQGGGSWSPTGVVVYSDEGSLYAIPDAGGTPTLLKRWGEAGSGFVWLNSPEVLDDGEHMLYAVNSTDPARAGTYFGTLTSSSRDDRRIVPEWGDQVTYASSGHLVFVRNQVVMAQPFDGVSGRLQGVAIPVAGTMVRNPAVSVSRGGLLTFGGGDAGERLAWLDRQGRPLATLKGVEGLRNLELSPDQRLLLGDSAVQPLSGTWLFDLERRVQSRIGTSAVRQPQWSPDGSRIAFTEQQGEVRGIYVRPTGQAQAELLLDTPEVKFVSDWTDDGRYLVYVSTNATTLQDLWVLPMSGPRDPQPYLRTPANEMQGRVSPDGRWIAYASDESGRHEVYVDSFPVPGAKITISNGGGAQPQWRDDGRELYYLAGDGTLLAVAVRAGRPLQLGRSQALFRLTLPVGPFDDRIVYAVSGDGSRFLVASVDDEGAPEPMTMLVNWTGALTRRVAAAAP